MLDDQVTSVKELVERINAFRTEVTERRRFGRKEVLWAATVEIRGKRCEGLIVDFSPGGARIRFDAEAETGDDVIVMLDQFETLGAKVIWQYDGETGVHFVLAPEEVAERVKAAQTRDLGEPAADPARP